MNLSRGRSSPLVRLISMWGRHRLREFHQTKTMSNQVNLKVFVVHHVTHDASDTFVRESLAKASAAAMVVIIDDIDQIRDERYKKSIIGYIVDGDIDNAIADFNQYHREKSTGVSIHLIPVDCMEDNSMEERYESDSLDAFRRKNIQWQTE